MQKIISKVYNIQRQIERLPVHILGKITYRCFNIFLRNLLPIYYKKKNHCGINKCSNREEKIIVSLTTFPERISEINCVLQSLLNQTLKPDKIILWLADSQFPDKNAVRERFKSFIIRGVEIRYCEDLRAHKKYYCTMQEYPDAAIITVDDDLFYPEDLVEKLYKKHIEYPNAIVAMRAHRMQFENGELLPYNQWSTGAKGENGPDKYLFCTTGGGTLFPGKCFGNECFDPETIKEICLLADDVWINCMRILANIEVIKVEKFYPEYCSLKCSQATGLANDNVLNNMNDIQLNKVIKKFNIKFESDNE